MPNFNKITYKNYVPIYILSRPKMEASRYILCVPRVGGGGRDIYDIYFLSMTSRQDCLILVMQNGYGCFLLGTIKKSYLFTCFKI